VPGGSYAEVVDCVDAGRPASIGVLEYGVGVKLIKVGTRKGRMDFSCCIVIRRLIGHLADGIALFRRVYKRSFERSQGS
jgi:hypothetical protein